MSPYIIALFSAYDIMCLAPCAYAGVRGDECSSQSDCTDAYYGFYCNDANSCECVEPGFYADPNDSEACIGSR